MSPSKFQAVAILGALASTVSAHGLIDTITVDGTEFEGYDPSFQYSATPTEVIEWSCPECQDNGFVEPSMYNDVTKIACHKDATAGAKVATVKAGGTIDIKWTTWPESHNGPVLDYLAKVDDATAAKAEDLEFFKIDEAGFDNGQWAAAKLIANDLTWTVTVPSNIAAGQYVLRHEIIALHSAGQENGAQNYPKCFNIEVTGGGSETPAGVTADKLYTSTDPGILVSIYGDNTGYEIPGPALFDGANSGSGSAGDTSPSASASPVGSTAASTSVTTASATAAPATSAASSAASSAATSPSSIEIEQNVQTSLSEVATPTATEAPIPTDAIYPIVSEIASITTAIPSSILTEVLPTILPTGAVGANATDPIPEKPLPESVTLKDLLDWLSFVMGNIVKGKNRKHPRDF